MLQQHYGGLVRRNPNRFGNSIWHTLAPGFEGTSHTRVSNRSPSNSFLGPFQFLHSKRLKTHSITSLTPFSRSSSILIREPWRVGSSCAPLLLGELPRTSAETVFVPQGPGSLAPGQAYAQKTGAERIGQGHSRCFKMSSWAPFSSPQAPVSRPPAGDQSQMGGYVTNVMIHHMLHVLFYTSLYIISKTIYN